MSDRKDVVETSSSTTVDASSAMPVVVWIGGWLFTVGFVRLGFWKGFWALIAWPYYIGAHFAK